MNAQPRNTIVLSPIGNPDIELLHAIRRAIRRIFSFPSEIVNFTGQVDLALDPARNQYHSTLILEDLARTAPSSAIKVLAITNVDLFIPILTHVYGEAQLGGKACIISTYRLGTPASHTCDREGFILRAVKEAIHELGHTFNLRHCQDHHCIMHYCRSIRDVDRKGDELCRYCRVLLEGEIRRLTPDKPFHEKAGLIR